MRIERYGPNGLIKVEWDNTKPSADDVRLEAQRRLLLLWEARDPNHLNLKMMNAMREQIRWSSIKANKLSDAETKRISQLELLDQLTELIRTRSNAMELNPPEDYTDEKRWL